MFSCIRPYKTNKIRNQRQPALRLDVQEGEVLVFREGQAQPENRLQKGPEALGDEVVIWLSPIVRSKFWENIHRSCEFQQVEGTVHECKWWPARYRETRTIHPCSCFAIGKPTSGKIFYGVIVWKAWRKFCKTPSISNIVSHRQGYGLALMLEFQLLLRSILSGSPQKGSPFWNHGNLLFGLDMVRLQNDKPRVVSPILSTSAMIFAIAMDVEACFADLEVSWNGGVPRNRRF